MTKEIFREWILAKIVENPQLYGGDKGNPAIIHTYLSELHTGTKVEDLTYEEISQSVAVSRMRNSLLEIFPEYDFREKYKPKHKREDEE
jgi:hypothetical protein